MRVMKPDIPLVSVIIPCYNHEDYIQACIQSVIDQSYENIELIILDDGSKDHSVEKIQGLIAACQARFSRFEFRARPNKGLSVTLNEGLGWAQGAYFSAIASDDMMAKDKIQIQIDYALKNPDVTSIYGGIQLIDENGNLKQKNIGEYGSFSFEEIFLNEHNLPAPTQLHKMDDFMQLGGFDESTKIEDWDILLKLSKSNKKIVYLPELLAFYRIHSGNTFSKNDLMINELFKIIEIYKGHALYKLARFKIIKIYKLTPLKKVNKLKYLWLRFFCYIKYRVL